MKNKERLRAIVREWIDDKLGIELMDELANKIVDNIIGYEEEELKHIGINYVSKNDAALKEESDCIRVNNRMPEENA